MNTDAVIQAELGKVGVGIIIRDSTGNVLASSAQSIEVEFSPSITEAFVLLKGLKMARESGLWPCEVEIDARNVVHLIGSPNPLLSEIGLVIKDIKLILETSPKCSMAFVRSANMVAHHLAKLGLEMDNDCFWMEDCPPPPRVVPFVLGGCPSLM
ncbi:hypothetical protein Dsin_026756 [Dipteronia sinensis]|uniref:RNase H type-1 domain-containing protein n=1 Tax=Dipteronia sinensis TaxID=43782 RepID=A0AAD9ZYG3_9ROSI|nr:hypothetical protein Dsin_026756 [Dipteronia sinensis]